MTTCAPLSSASPSWCVLLRADVQQVEFVRETPEQVELRKYREEHDAQGNHFPNPNRRQRRHIAATWRGHDRRAQRKN